jgi:hypothetical protein
LREKSLAKREDILTAVWYEMAKITCQVMPMVFAAYPIIDKEL